MMILPSTRYTVNVDDFISESLHIRNIKKWCLESRQICLSSRDDQIPLQTCLIHFKQIFTIFPPSWKNTMKVIVHQFKRVDLKPGKPVCTNSHQIHPKSKFFISSKQNLRQMAGVNRCQNGPDWLKIFTLILFVVECTTIWRWSTWKFLFHYSSCLINPTMGSIQK